MVSRNYRIWWKVLIDVPLCQITYHKSVCATILRIDFMPIFGPGRKICHYGEIGVASFVSSFSPPAICFPPAHSSHRIYALYNSFYYLCVKFSSPLIKLPAEERARFTVGITAYTLLKRRSSKSGRETAL